MSDADPHMHAFHFADGAGLDQLHDTTIIISCMNLRAHLGDELFLFGQIGQYARFMNGVGEGFFAVDVFAHAKCHGGGRSVGVIRCAYQHSINFVRFPFQHDAEVTVFACVGKFLCGGIQRVGIHISHGNDGFVRGTRYVGGSASPGADGGDLKFVVRRLCFGNPWEMQG
jgi:hypothetical protein